MEQLKEIVDILKMLSNENRLGIVCHLIEKDLTVNELHEKMGHISQPALSQHLAMLKATKILESKKNGLTMTYSIKDQRIIKIIETLKANYCD